jgi:UPF0716 protein FxsA
VAVLALLFLVVPLLELFVIIQVGQAIGALNTVGLLLIDSLIGGWLMKREGIAALRRFQSKLSSGQLPENELIDGFCILFGGALMLTPGFISDLLGMALLLPPVRAVLRPIVRRQVSKRIVLTGPGGTSSFRRDDVIDL